MLQEVEKRVQSKTSILNGLEEKFGSIDKTLKTSNDSSSVSLVTW